VFLLTLTYEKEMPQTRMTVNSNKPHGSIWEESATRSVADSLREDTDAEVVVIGGGLTGLSAALHLAQRGKSVTVIEAKTIGFGGSGRNNGQVIPTLAAVEPDAMIARHGEVGERFIGLVKDSASELFDLVRKHYIDCDAEQMGWFQPSHSVDYLRLSESRVKAWQRLGAPAEMLDASQAEALLGSKHWHGGMLNPTGGHVNPLKLTQGLAQVCETAGVKIYENTPAQSVTRQGEGWQIKTPNGILNADAILLATNAYTDDVAPLIKKSIVPITAWQLATPPLTDEQRETIIPGRQAISDTRGDLWYFRYDAQNRLVTGSSLLIRVKAKPRLSQSVAKRLETAFPQLGKVDFTHVWSGNVGVTQNFYPRFHQFGPNYWGFTGYNGRGLALTIPIGREMAGLICGEAPALPMTEPELIPVHGVARHVARVALIRSRWRDRQPPKL
jgi:glycine/D-amino acid oxidase-like deaminating enzyme